MFQLIIEGLKDPVQWFDSRESAVFYVLLEFPLRNFQVEEV